VRRTSIVVPRGRVVTGAVVVALSAMSGCGGGGETGHSTRPHAALPNELIGAWTRTFTQRDVGSTGFATGRYTLKIRDGEVDVYEGSGADPTNDCSSQVGACASVDLTGSGRILTLGKTPSCTGLGRYAFVVKGNMLLTTKVADDCDAGRPVVFSDRTWKRAG
jgi:hypothetical protein